MSAVIESIVPHTLGSIRPLSRALNYISRGWSPIPIPHKEKGPRIQRWTDLRINEGQADIYFDRQDLNIGVLLGEPSGGLVDVDFDTVEAARIAPVFLPQTSVFGRRSNPRTHWLYICEIGTKKYAEPDGKMLLELRSTGAQTVFPGSVHTSGEYIEWEEDISPVSIEPNDLLSRLGKIAAATALARHWPKEGRRHETALALSGALLRSGFKDEDAEAFISAVAEAARDDEVTDRVACVKHTRMKLGRGEPITGLPRISEIIGQQITQKVSDWLCLGQEETLPEYVIEMNRKYMVVNENGKTLVFSPAHDEILERDYFIRHKFEDLRKLYQNKLVTVGMSKKGEPIMKNQADAWFGHPRRHEYTSGVIFGPGKVAPPGVLNLWKGLAIEPKAGSWVPHGVGCSARTTRPTASSRRTFLRSRSASSTTPEAGVSGTACSRRSSKSLARMALKP